MSNYPQSVQYLYSLGNEVKSIKLGLERMVTLLEELGNPERHCPWVHVAGTNGKGSTCAMIESGLRASGRRTGLFTSPHLVEPSERIRISGVPVSEADFAFAFDQVHEAAERLLADGRIDMHTTYFETVAAMAFVLFRQFDVETGVIEVGLGGRLDATNVIIPRVSVITSIDYDHQQWLGHDVRTIAAEKAGIMKRGVPVVIGPQAHAEVMDVLVGRANAVGAEVVRADDWNVSNLSLNANGCSFVVSHGGELDLDCNLAGRHQADNALTAAVALREIGIAREAIECGIRQARWPGRLERLCDSPETIADGAHNPAGARALAEYLRTFHAGRRISLIFAAMKDKAVEDVAPVLFPLAHELIFTAADTSRSRRPEALAAQFSQWPSKVAARLADALGMAANADLVIITGSLFLVGEARRMLAKE